MSTYSVHGNYQAIASLQSQYPDLILCGASALILKGILPTRPVGDIDFVSNRFDTILDLNLHYDHYSDSKNKDEYSSYSGYYGILKINVLHFKDGVSINLDQIFVKKGNRDFKIVCQDAEDILCWKQRYGRPKDLVDLDNIASNMLEKEIFTK